MFLEVITRTYKRPTMLAACGASLLRQTDRDFEHVILHDETGIGIAATYECLRSHEPKGEWVLVLDDDNVILDESLIEKLKIQASDGAEIIWLTCKIGNRILPDTREPMLGHVDMMNIVVSKAVWMRHRMDFGARYEGDWDFIASVSQIGYQQGFVQSVCAQTQRVSHGKPEDDYGLIGETVIVEHACAGLTFSYSQGQHVLVTHENALHMESLYRGGIVNRLAGEQTTVDGPKEKTLIFCPTARLEPETVRSIFAQKLEGMDVMFTFDNPITNKSRTLYRNIQYNYEKMRTLALERGYQRVFIIESDIILPSNALELLMSVNAPAVTGLYVLRHGVYVPNLGQYTRTQNLGTAMDWTDIVANWGKVIEVSGGSMGCLLLDTAVLRNFSFYVSDDDTHDMALMRHIWKSGYKHMAHLGVVCGHKRPDGIILWPDKECGYSEKAA